MKVVTHDLTVLGLDLGKIRDHSAIVGLRFVATEEQQRQPFPPMRKEGFSLTLLERLALGTTYDAVMKRVVKVAEHFAGKGPVYLVVDASGVGEPVVEELSRRLAAVHVPYSRSFQGWEMGVNRILLRAVVITGGGRAVIEGTRAKVPKRDLVAALALELERGGVQFAAGLALLPELFAELSAFTSVIKSATHTQLEGADGEHDDMVLAFALGVWFVRDKYGRSAGERDFSILCR